MIVIILLALIIVFTFIYIYETREKLEPPPVLFRTSNTILAMNADSDTSYAKTLDERPLPPEIKDNYNEWVEKGFVTPLKDQMLCGGCWAFAACSSLSDRICIATAGKWTPEFGLSDQYLISCGTKLGMKFYQGCDGGIPQFVFEALNKNGIPIDKKLEQNVSGGGGGSESSRSGGVVNPNDRNLCSTLGVYGNPGYTYWQNGCKGEASCNLNSASSCPCEVIQQQFDTLKIYERFGTVGIPQIYSLHGKDRELNTIDLWPDIPQNVIADNCIRMKKAIYYEGPFTIGFRVTSDFFTYWNKATADNYYEYDGRSPMTGGHAAVIVGWKTLSNGTPVWIVKNSWGGVGGYGFPGIKWTDPVTGKTVEKYPGGFWNHIMGKNDSFIESNCTGGLPNLSAPELKEYFTKLPEKWYETLTVRQVYEMAGDSSPAPIPDKEVDSAPTPSPSPQPQIDLSTLKPGAFKKIIPLDQASITPESIQLVMDNKNWILGATNNKTLQDLINFVKTTSISTSSEMNTFYESLKPKFENEYIIIGVPGKKIYWYVYGNPLFWSAQSPGLFPAATSKKIGHNIFNRALGFNMVIGEN